MKTPHLNDLERRAYRTVVDDGLLDLAFGLLFLSFWLSGRMPFDGLPGIAFVLLVYGWTVARRTLVEPRVGTVHLGPKRKARVRRGRRWVAGFMAVPVVALFLWAAVLSDAAEPLGGYGSLVIATTFALALGVGGWFLELRRFWLYAAVLMAASLWGTFVSEPIDRFQFAVSGGVAVVVGAVVLVRFLRRHPPPDGDDVADREATHG